MLNHVKPWQPMVNHARPWFPELQPSEQARLVLGKMTRGMSVKDFVVPWWIFPVLLTII